MTIGNMARNQVMVNRIMVGDFGGVRGNQGLSPQAPHWPNLNVGSNNNFATSPAIREAGRSMLESVQALTQRQSPVSNLRAATTNADVAAVAVDNSRINRTNPPRDVSLNVEQIARAQTNAGDTVAARGRAVNSGNYAFTIEAGGRTHEFTINVLDTDNNESIQRRMAAAINQRNIGIRAEVGTTAATNNAPASSALTLTAANTGTNAAFTVTDTRGDLAATMGVDTINTEAQNAVYRIDGGPARTSQTNQVSLAPGAAATLRDAGTAEISFARDTASAVAAATNLIDSINAALRNTRPSDGPGAERFISDIQLMNRINAPALSRAGIDVGFDGRLEINEDRLERAAQDGSLERLFSADSAFVSRAEQIATNATRTNLYQNISSNFSFNPGGQMFFPHGGNTWSMLSMLF